MKVLQVIEDSTGDIVKEYDVTNKNERQLDKFEKSVLLRIDLERFHTNIDVKNNLSNTQAQ